MEAKQYSRKLSVKGVHTFDKYHLNIWSGKPVKFCLHHLPVCFQFSKYWIIFQGLLIYRQYLLKSHNLHWQMFSALFHLWGICAMAELAALRRWDPQSCWAPLNWENRHHIAVNLSISGRKSISALYAWMWAMFKCNVGIKTTGLISWTYLLIPLLAEFIPQNANIHYGLDLCCISQTWSQHTPLHTWKLHMQLQIKNLGKA